VHGLYEAYPQGDDLYAAARRIPLGHEMAETYLYMPLVHEPELLLRFVALSDKEITEEVWLDWIRRDGVLGLDRPANGYAKAHTCGGPRETLSRFVDEAHAANRALRLYEAATKPGGPDVAVIESYIPNYERQNIEDTVQGIEAWAREEAATVVQRRLATECHPQLYALPLSGGFAHAPDFKSLLGAMHLQMMFLMTSTGKIRRCKAPGCNRTITFDHPEEPPGQRLERLAQGRRKKHKTRIDKVYCGQACKVRAHAQNKKHISNSR
jgi:hypothetical protein